MNTSSFLPSSVKQRKEAELLESFVETVSSTELEIGDEPLSKFDTANLATLAFPTLFPDGLGDPTDSATV